MSVWLNHLVFHEMFGEKGRWEPHNDTACCFEPILKAAPYKIASVWQLTSCLADQKAKQNIAEHNWISQDILICDILLWTLIQGNTNVG